MTQADQLLASLAVLRRQWRRRILLEALAWVALAAVIGLVVAFAISRVTPASGPGLVAIRVVAYGLIVGALIRFLVVPLARRTSDQRFALYVEEHAPELKQSLLSAVHELHAPEAMRASPSLAARLITRTVSALGPLQSDGRIERPRVVRALRVFGATVVAGALLVLLGPDSLRDTARAVFVPWSTAEAATPVMSVRVVPGNASVPKGASVDVGASLSGFSSDSAELSFRTDSTQAWTRLPMSRDKTDGRFTSRLFDVAKATDYYVESNGVRSALYKLSVSNLPAVSRLALDVRYPAYTRIPPDHVTDGGDVAAVVGSTVTVRPAVTMPVRGGTISFDNGVTVPLAADSSGLLSGSFRVTSSGFYRIDLTTTEGATVTGPVQYAVDAIPDRPPRVRIEKPGRDTKVTNVEELTIDVGGSDDYGVESMELRYRVNGGEERRVALGAGGRGNKEPRAAYTMFLEEMGLTPGDLIAYNAVARDGAGNTGSSDVYFLEVRPFGKNYRQAEQQGGGGGGGGGGDSPEGFVARQREVVAATFNWLRDSATTAPRKHREDIATINIAEGRLREDVATLRWKMQKRGAMAADTMFVHIDAEAARAVAALRAAEELLVKGQGRDALPPEQQALQALQRAEALYRDVQVQFGGQQQGGGGGGGGQRPEDLADLFELQTDKLRNQYEAVQSESRQPQQQAERATDEALERLKELAQRQQQENERMQRLAEAMRERLGRDQSASAGGGGGGGGASQRELARQAEEEARRLERLSRERQSPELEQAAQQLQRAADAMRRAATGTPQQGQAALEQLGRAASGLEGARSDRVSESVRQLERQARGLQDRQREIVEQVRASAGGTPQQREEQIRRLSERKDSLARALDEFEANADRVSRDGRREQPAASRKVGEAAQAVREQRIRDKVAYSKNAIRSTSSEYANALEGQISDNIADVAERMRAATGAIGAAPTDVRQNRALDQTRELVRGMESLRDQMAQRGARGQQGQQSAQGQQQGQNGQRGAQGQQGQREGQQGQGGQQGQQGQQGQRGGQQGAQGQQSAQGGQQGGQQRGGSAQQGGQNPAGGAPVDGSLNDGDARQFSRAFGLRRGNAEALRRQLAGEGIDVAQLDRALDAMRQLERSGALDDPRAVERLETQVIDGLKDFEFALARKLGGAQPNGPALGTRSPVPEEYRAAVEEYYRSLAGGRREK